MMLMKRKGREKGGSSDSMARAVVLSNGRP